MIAYFWITPCLGCIRNYVKYKQLSFQTFLRTPLTYMLFYIFYFMTNQRCIVWKTLISERWFFFIYKTWKSIRNDDYNTKKEKYKKKYCLEYEQDKGTSEDNQ